MALPPPSGLVGLWCVIMAATGGRDRAGLQSPRPGCDQASSAGWGENDDADE